MQKGKVIIFNRILIIAMIIIASNFCIFSYAQEQYNHEIKVNVTSKDDIECTYSLYTEEDKNNPDKIENLPKSLDVLLDGYSTEKVFELNDLKFTKPGDYIFYIYEGASEIPEVFPVSPQKYGIGIHVDYLLNYNIHIQVIDCTTGEKTDGVVFKNEGQLIDFPKTGVKLDTDPFVFVTAGSILFLAIVIAIIPKRKKE